MRDLDDLPNSDNSSTLEESEKGMLEAIPYSNLYPYQFFRRSSRRDYK